MFTVDDETARYDADEFSLIVSGTNGRGEYGKRAWQWEILTHVGATTYSFAFGDDLYGHGDSREMLCSLAGFLYADAERYRHYMGPITELYGEDGYAFGAEVAEWAYGVSDELSLIDQDEDEDN